MKRLLGIIFVLWANILFGQSYGDYYQSAEGLKTDALKAALHNIIKGHTELPYTASTTDVWDMLKQTDKDPNNSENVILIYSGISVNAAQEYSNATGWTREHVWAKSRGDFGTEIGPGTDAHHLRPEDDNVNSIRGNRSFDNCQTCVAVLDKGIITGSFTDANVYTFEPRDEVKGDVARMIFYMATRYEGDNNELDLELTELIPDLTDKSPFHGRLSTLIKWNREDPVSDWERNRNDVIYTQFQHNRNPYIDIPELVEYIWGNAVGTNWSSAFGTYPKDGETNVAINTTIRFVFSAAIRNIDDSEITNTNVANLLVLKETDTNGAIVAFTTNIDTDKKVITVTPASDLKNNQIYYASLAAVEDANNVANSFTEISFTTIEADLTAPTFEFDPVNGATGIAINRMPKITFNEAIRNIDDSEITNANVASLLTFKETDGNGADVTFTATIDANKKVITLTHTSNLKNNQLYYISIDAVEDANNNAISASHTTFTTADVTQSSDVIISQYYEGASNDKFIEITNLGSESVDLSTYYLGRFSNTFSPADNSVYNDGNALSGSIAADQTLVYKNASAVNPTYAVTNSVASTTATYFNGDDPVALMNGGNTWANRIDVIYAEGSWGAERSFYRKASVTTGNKNMSVLDGSGEWTQVSLAEVASANSTDSEYLGTHVSGTVSAVDDLLNPEINIYPNPSTGKFYVEVGESFKINTKIEVFNLIGMKVFETLVRDSKTELDLSTMKQGIYYVRVDDGKNSFTQKVVKQ